VARTGCQRIGESWKVPGLIAHFVQQRPAAVEQVVQRVDGRAQVGCQRRPRSFSSGRRLPGTDRAVGRRSRSCSRGTTLSAPWHLSRVVFAVSSVGERAQRVAELLLDGSRRVSQPRQLSHDGANVVWWSRDSSGEFIEPGD